MSKSVRILLGALLLALMTAYFGVYVYSITLPRKGSYGGWNAFWDGKGEPTVTNVDPKGLATGLQVGDEMIAINGVKVKDDPRILNYAVDAPPGTHYTMTIRRGGELRDVIVQTTPPVWLTQVVSTAAALGLLFLPIFVHFFLIFPEPSPLLHRFARLETWIYLPYLLLLLPVLVALRLPGETGLWMLRYQWFRYLVIAINFLLVAYMAAGLTCLLINYRAASPIARRRLRVVMAGSGVGFFNLFLLGIGGPFELQPLMPALWSWLGMMLFITLPLIPLSFVYAIVRHKVIPVSLIIRRGLRYLLVKRGSILLMMVVVSVALFFAMDTFFYFNQMTGRAVGITSAIVAIAVWQLARVFHLRVIAPQIDRLFFHQAYDARQIIAELAESLRATTSLPQLLELVATKIQSALHASNVAVLLRDEASGDYPCVYFCVYSFHNRRATPYPCDGGLARDSAVIARMIESGQLINLEGRGELQSEAGGSNELSSEDLETLRKLNSALLLPITTKDELLGVVSIGAHLGDLPFSSDDKSLLLSGGLDERRAPRTIQSRWRDVRLFEDKRIVGSRRRSRATRDHRAIGKRRRNLGRGTPAG